MTPTQSPTLASQATAELPSLKSDFEAAMREGGYKPDFLVLEGSDRYAYMETEWAFRGYEAGRASRAQSEWISVETRLPEENVPVLVTKDGGHEYIDLDIMEEGVWRDWAEYVEHVEIIGGRTSDVMLYTHWAPIPKAATPGETK